VTPVPVRTARVPDVRRLYDGVLSTADTAFALRHVDRMFPTRTVARGERVSPLQPTDPFDSELQRLVDDHVRDHVVTGFAVLHRGRLVHEQYRLGNGRRARTTSMSMVKSMCTTLVGVAVHQGRLASLDEPLTDHVRELRGSAYDDVTIRQVLQMRSGVGWDETYTDPASDRRRMLDAQLAQEPGAILRLMASLPRAAPPGTRWCYSTGETHVVGALVRSLFGRPVAEVLSEAIWRPMGAEADAAWWLESPDGLEVGGSGLAMRLRDLARFGRFVLDGGVADSVRYVAEGFLAEATLPAAQRHQGEPPYGFMWWLVDDGEHGAVHAGAFQAAGIFGQHLYLHPAAGVVIAQTAAQARPIGAEPFPPEHTFGAIVEGLYRR
jgi:CubicO group peptidase (beta-lactamase class C family)